MRSVVEGAAARSELRKVLPPSVACGASFPRKREKEPDC